MNEQNESLLFRLPRELRDEVYHYYVLEEDGYHHDATSDKLRQASGRPINLSLQYTCKKTATEMEGLALQVNRVTFRTKLEVPEPDSECSNALLWNHLLCERERPLRRMFEWSYTLVTLEAIQRLRELHPDSTAAEQIEKAFIRMGNRIHWLSPGTLFNEGLVWSIDYTAHTTLLQDLLQILSTHPEFWRLTSKEYTRESEENDNGRIVHEDLEYPNQTVQALMLGWRPDPWRMPDRAEFDTIFEFLPRPPAIVEDFDRGWYLDDTYYSATAVTIRFLERLPPATRTHLRNITIQENEISEAHRQTHARGLIPFCCENLKLRIERRVDVFHQHFLSERMGLEDGIEEIAPWFVETKFLKRLGMPPDSFRLVLHGPTPRASQRLSDLLIKLAIWDEGCTVLEHRLGPSSDYVVYPMRRGFADGVKKMVTGELPARIEADMGHVWDINQLLDDHVGEWPALSEDVYVKTATRHAGHELSLEEED
ncbi:uncharacterized protein J4E79_001608 [Alternaria viburni]|uniref:uncharacterized protein n=1 Tax=Alternaria viburni TaxID=566460 RepID=UPI0020C3EC7C|nr:uncharacterized protein J4E79_001608 [Alternaria viburni]KAI4669563.1 hypothetical protein J4E79_001608 [Alternaria viburni]